MTRAELEVRDVLEAYIGSGVIVGNHAEVAALAREWRVSWELWIGKRCANPSASSTFADEEGAKFHVQYLGACDDGVFVVKNILTESRTPAGPWERAE